jgi:hypothetical protein
MASCVVDFSSWFNNEANSDVMLRITMPACGGDLEADVQGGTGGGSLATAKGQRSDGGGAAAAASVALHGLYGHRIILEQVGAAAGGGRVKVCARRHGRHAWGGFAAQAAPGAAVCEAR